MWMLPAGQVWGLIWTKPEDVPPERNRVLHVQPTVDVDHLTGDIGGLLVRQKEDRSGDLRRFRHASDGNGLDDLIQILFWNLTRHGRFHESRGHRIDGDPLLCGFKREGLGEPDDRGLRSEEHTSELQSQSNLVCRLLLEKKKITDVQIRSTSQI